MAKITIMVAVEKVVDIPDDVFLDLYKVNDRTESAYEAWQKAGQFVVDNFADGMWAYPPDDCGLINIRDYATGKILAEA